jgi:hypothetical protein
MRLQNMAKAAVSKADKLEAKTETKTKAKSPAKKTKSSSVTIEACKS